MHIRNELPVTIVPYQTALGISFDGIDLETTCNIFAKRSSQAPFGYLATPNAVHVVHVFRGDRRFIDGINAAEFVTCDSRVVRNLVRRMFHQTLPIATGSDITARLLSEVVDPQDQITVIGGDEALAKALRDKYGLRGLRIHVPPMNFIQDEVAVRECVQFIRDNPARFVFLACGAPQSEMLASEVRRQGGATGLGLCVGASLLFATGRIARAPHFMQRMSLEWLHRLAHDPKRLAKRLWKSQLPLFWVAICYWFAGPANATNRARAVAWQDAVMKSHKAAF